MGNLFSVQGQNKHYERVRDPRAWLRTRSDGTAVQRQEKLDAYIRLRQRMEFAWSTFEGSAEKNFLHGLRSSFWPGWFELYLQHLLIDHGLSNKATNGQGEADFIVHEGGRHRFDIEATILTAGCGANSAPSFQLPDTDRPVVQNVSDKLWVTSPEGTLEQVRNPHAQTDYCLRLTSTLSAKLKQIKRWKESGSCDPESVPVVVAISSGYIEYDTNGMLSHSQFERVLYGKGDLLLPVETHSDDSSTPTFDTKRVMTNKNEADIILNLFDLEEFRDISAVVHFPDGLLEYQSDTPVFYLNPNAHVQFPTDVLMVGVYKALVDHSITVVVDYRD